MNLFYLGLFFLFYLGLLFPNVEIVTWQLWEVWVFCFLAVFFYLYFLYPEVCYLTHWHFLIEFHLSFGTLDNGLIFFAFFFLFFLTFTIYFLFFLDLCQHILYGFIPTLNQDLFFLAFLLNLNIPPMALIPTSSFSVKSVESLFLFFHLYGRLNC